MKKAYVLSAFCFLVLLLAGFFPTANCMDEVFAPTRRKYSDDRWYVLGNVNEDTADELRKKYPDPGEARLQYAMMSREVNELQKFFGKNKLYSINEPSLLQGITIRSGLRFYYPLEFAIDSYASVEIINELIRLGASVKNYKGYDPLLHILSKYYCHPDNPKFDLAEQYLATLVKHGANPAERPQYTERTYEQNYFLGSDSPLISIQKLIAGLKNDLTNNRPTRNAYDWGKITNQSIEKLEKREIEWKKLSTQFAASKTTDQTPTENPSIIPPALPSTATAPPRASLPNQPAGQPKLSWKDTVSQWCKNTQSGSAKTPICIVAIALTAVASRILYKTLFKQHTNPPAQITIINDADTSITLAYKTNTSTDITSITLRPKENWLLDINKIKLDILVTQLETVQAPLAINLSKYKASAHQKDQSLRITILKSSPIRYLLFKIPYTYSVKWTSDK